MVRPGSIAAFLVACLATIGVSSAHTEPAADTIPAAVDGAQEAVVWLRYRPAGAGNGRDEETVAPRQKLIQTLKSPVILVSALRQPGIAALETVQNEEQDPMAWLVAALDVTAPEGNNLIRIGLRGERADDLRQIVDAVTQAFIAEVVEREKTDLLARRDQLEKKFKELQTDIRVKLDALAATADPSDAFFAEINQCLRVLEQIGLELESTARDLKKPPSIEPVEAPTDTEKP